MPAVNAERKDRILCRLYLHRSQNLRIIRIF